MKALGDALERVHKMFLGLGVAKDVEPAQEFELSGSPTERAVTIERVVFPSTCAATNVRVLIRWATGAEESCEAWLDPPSAPGVASYRLVRPKTIYPNDWIVITGSNAAASSTEFRAGAFGAVVGVPS